MTAIEALKVALAKEKTSIELYRVMSIKYKNIREMFDFLLNEEQRHYKLIKDKIVELTKY